MASALAALASACGARAPATPPAPGTRAPVRLVFYAVGFPPAGAEKGVYDRALAEYQRDFPWVTVEFTGVPSYDEHYQKLVILFASGTPPDLTDTGSDTQRHAEAGNIRAVDDLVRRWRRTDIFPAALEQVAWKGKPYAMPYLGLARTLTYRRDFFAEVGLDPNRPPQDQRELREYAVRLTRREGTEIVRAGIGLLGSFVEFGAFLWQNGGEYLDPSGKRATFNSPEGVEALEFMANLALRDRTYPVGGTSAWSIVTGKGAMDHFYGSRLLVRMKQQAPDQYQALGAALPPKGAKRRACRVAFNAFATAAKTKHPEEALGLLRVCTDQGFQIGIDGLSGHLPVQKSVADVAPYIREEPRYKVYFDAFQFGKNEPSHPKWIPILNDVLAPALKQALTGQVAPKSALDEAAAVANRILAT